MEESSDSMLQSVFDVAHPERRRLQRAFSSAGITVEKSVFALGCLVLPFAYCFLCLPLPA